jgi:hypothetical protein
MSLAKCLSQVLDLPVAIAAKEAQSKLSQTYMLINGELIFVQEASGTYLETLRGRSSKTFGESDVDTLEVWLPKTGVYYRKGTNQAVLLSRRPMRQWKRSFSPSFYGVEFLNNADFSLDQLDINSHQEFWVASNKNIMYFTKPIGYVKNSSEIICTVPYFQQELTDWLREIK